MLSPPNWNCDSHHQCEKRTDTYDDAIAHALVQDANAIVTGHSSADRSLRVRGQSLGYPRRKFQSGRGFTTQRAHHLRG